MATRPTHGALNWDTSLLAYVDDSITEAVAPLAGSTPSDSDYTDSDAVNAVSTRLVNGVHPGMTITKNSATGNIDIKPNFPVLVLATGAAVPAGTAPNTIIFRS